MANPSGAGPDDLACIDLVKKVTEYLDGERTKASERASNGTSRYATGAAPLSIISRR